MFGINWTGAGQSSEVHTGGRDPSPPGHHCLFLMTVLAFAIVYAIGAISWLVISFPLSERWPMLLYPATPFVTVLGAWKLVRWFGFWRVALPAIVFIVTAMLTEPLWVSAILDEDPIPLLVYWKAALLVCVGLAGWLMAALALVIGPIRMVVDRLR